MQQMTLPSDVGDDTFNKSKTIKYDTIGAQGSIRQQFAHNPLNPTVNKFDLQFCYGQKRRDNKDQSFLTAHGIVFAIQFSHGFTVEWKAKNDGRRLPTKLAVKADHFTDLTL